MEKIKKLETKRIISEYSFVKTNDEYIKEIISINTPKFLKEINDLMEELNIENNQQDNNKKSEKKDKIYNLSEFTESTKIKMKKIYREIVKITHPDKIDDVFLNLIYIESKEAYYHNDIMELFYICDNLGIGIEIDDSDILTFNRIIEDKKKKSKSVEQSYLWLWANSKSDEEKKEIVKLFVEKTYGK